MPKITPFLWFDKEAEDAAHFYVSLFKNSQVLNVTQFGDAGTDPGTTKVVEFEIDGQKVTAMDGGPHFKFNEAFSWAVDCEDQEEVDRLWSELTADGGEESQCGWLKDKYGLSWQIIPRRLFELMSDPDPEKAKRVWECMLTMQKIDVAALEEAAAGD
jgi:predicted 3-demethylubiquinone-9 3-methyltransferase (glyoxalase superfamily)